MSTLSQKLEDRSAFSTNVVLADILATGVSKSADGAGTVAVHSAITLSEGEMLQRVVRLIDPTVSLEIGLAYGVSALFICDALKVRSGTEHIVIDPNQYVSTNGFCWDGIGMANLRRAGHGDIVRLIEEPSYRALPELERSGCRVDFAFIDGWHTFDFALVDFFFIDRMLNVGGVVAFDDMHMPAIRKLCRFVKTSLAYSILAVSGSSSAPTFKRRASEQLLRRSPFRRLLRPEVATPDKRIGLRGTCIAFRKEADDTRPWSHFEDF
ncbi:MAG TPA: class I SAM-dependent methyltransferase [Terriglobia bacterium]|nr:class I SAM-dependent methyltransferase [Terriglobia bacterium]